MIAGLDDRRLLARDLGDRVPEIFLVIEVDVGDGRDAQVHCVRRVEAPAEPHLTHQHVDAGSEVLERHHCEHLELGRGPHLRGSRIEHRHEAVQRRREVVL